MKNLNHILGFFVFATFFLGGPYELAAAGECPSSMDIMPKMRIHKVYSDPKLVRNKSLKEINKMANGHKRMGEMVLGLTHAKSIVGVRINMLFQNVKGGVCAVPKEISVNVGYKEQTVWIPRKYRTGSCEYRRVYRHEMDHVAARRIEINSRFPDVRRALEKTGRKLSKAGKYKTVKFAQDTMVKYIASVAEASMEKVNAAADRRDKKIDNPAAVIKEQRLCKNW